MGRDRACVDSAFVCRSLFTPSFLLPPSSFLLPPPGGIRTSAGYGRRGPSVLSHGSPVRSGSSSSNAGAIAAGVIVPLVVIAIAAVLFVLWSKRNAQTKPYFAEERSTTMMFNNSVFDMGSSWCLHLCVCLCLLVFAYVCPLFVPPLQTAAPTQLELFLFPALSNPDPLSCFIFACGAQHHLQSALDRCSSTPKTWSSWGSLVRGSLAR